MIYNLSFKLRFVALILALFFSISTSAMAQNFVIDQSKSSITYSASHPLHDWEASSFKTSGNIFIDVDSSQNIQVNLAVPIESFDSQNSNRDSNMLDVVDVDRFPNVIFAMTSVTPNEHAGSDYNASWMIKGDLTFHGVTNQVEIIVEVQVSNGSLQATGDFSISLEDFKIKRPSLMLMKMKDNLDFSFDLWATESN